MPGPKVLVLDSVRSDRVWLAHFLARHGFVVAQHDRFEGVKRVLKEQRPTIAIVDVGLTGLPQGHAWIGEWPKTISLLLMAANAADVPRHPAIVDSLAKPVDRERLLDLLGRLTQRT